MARCVELQNHDGSHCRWLTDGEAERMKDHGEAFRITRRKDPKPKYRKRLFPEPSESHETACCLTLSDMRCLAGLQAVTEVRVERLIGFGVLREGTHVPAGGYF